MSKARMIMLTILALIASMVAGYAVVTMAFIGAWDVLGVHDQDGGGAMAVGFIFAPIGAVICGIIGAVWTASYLSRKMKSAPGPSPVAEASDARFLFRLACAAVGLVVGWKIAAFVQYLLMPGVYDNMLFAIAHAGTFYVVPIGFAAAGYWLAGSRKARTD